MRRGRKKFAPSRGGTTWSFPLRSPSGAARKRCTELSGLAFHQTREASDVAAGVAHEEAAGGADGVDDPHAEVAQGADRRDIVGEQAIQAVGRDGERERVEAAPALVFLQDIERADV